MFKAAFPDDDTQFQAELAEPESTNEESYQFNISFANYGLITYDQDKAITVS